jgi:ATP-dependent Clp protease ATP-binding subunit ClpA
LLPPNQHGLHESTLIRVSHAALARTSAPASQIGAAPGYVGFGSGGLLSEALRRRPHCVLLVRDLERAHPEVRKRSVVAKARPEQ